jgi:hypothetical protein
VTALFEQRPDELLELESGVVRSDGDLHPSDDSAAPGADTLGPWPVPTSIFSGRASNA